ncbi:hypothetical protein F4Z99_09530 [Candidatus Poribacteria bacterium]|nr:hypothetical protein [Candidatus Poribacteria bacterium]MYA98087.1 hypothetical protein [Candidatus Poribacteria bacterium]
MTEIHFYITQNEIEMIKDFMEGGCTIADINLQWMRELRTLLESIGHIVTAPGFDIEVQKEIATSVSPPKYKCHVCEQSFIKKDMKTYIMHEGKADTESRYNLCQQCHQLRGEMSDLETVFFLCTHCRNTLPHYVLEKTDEGWQCQKPYGSCYAK